MVARLVGVVLHHQRAFADQRGADDAVDRRADRRVIEIEFGARDVGLAPLDIGRRLALGSYGFFVLGLGRGLLAGQRGDAPRVQRSLFEHRLCLGERGFVGLHLDFKRTRIDLVERIAGLDLAALTKGTLGYDAGDARTHVGDTGRRDATRQFAHHRTCLRLDGDDADIGRRGRGGSGGDVRFVASRQQRRHRSDRQCKCGRPGCRLRAKS